MGLVRSGGVTVCSAVQHTKRHERHTHEQNRLREEKRMTKRITPKRRYMIDIHQQQQQQHLMEQHAGN